MGRLRLPDFTYTRAESLDHVFDVIEQRGDEAAIYAGGTELLLLMKLGFASPTHLVDIKHVPTLSEITRRADELAVGATGTYRSIACDDSIRQGAEPLVPLVSTLANPRVRNAGTLAGNLCFAEPHSDPATFLLALDARVRLVSSASTREVPIVDFIRGPFETCLELGELMTAVLLTPIGEGEVTRFRRIIHHGERPIVNFALHASKDRDPRLVVGAVSRKPLLLPNPRPALDAGTQAAIETFAKDAVSVIEVLADGETADYLYHLTQTHLTRFLMSVLEDDWSPTEDEESVR